ncbi:MAG: transcription-repair coupling factor, partial [Gammaproteobacteria bacterium]|nr:transcription-repair coupling factor [Gammaproteobacteria bacterium]
MTTKPHISPFQPILPDTKGDRRHWRRLYGSSTGLVISRAAGLHNGPVIVITPNTATANRLEEEVHFFLEDEDIPLLHFPDRETLPYDPFSPHQDIISERLAALHRLPTLERGIIIVPVTTTMERLPPREYLDGHSLVLATGDHLDTAEMGRRLEAAGYRHVSQVIEHGEFAIRGSLIDLFPMGSSHPYRIDLFDDEVDTIRGFDPETQRSRDKFDKIHLLPAKEYPLTKDVIGLFRRNWRTRFEGDPSQSPIYRDLSQGLAPAGIEYYLPLFFSHTHTLFDYLPETCLAITLEETGDAAESFWREAGERFEQGRHDRERPLLAPAELFLQVNELFGALKLLPRVSLERFTGEDSTDGINHATRTPTQLPINARAPDPLGVVKKYLNDFTGRVLLVAETPGRRETLLETFRSHGLRPAVLSSWGEFHRGSDQLAITVAPLETGIVLEEPPLAVVTEAQLFGARAMQRRRRKGPTRDAETVIRNLTELTVGSPVVHEDHGVGRYHGLQTLTAGEVTMEYLTLEYAGSDKLYVPVSSLHLISRYTGVDPEHAPLHKLGSNQWQKAKKKAMEKVYDVAAELLEIHARRAARKGQEFEIEQDQYQAFVQAFPFEETADQQTAIDQVLDDLTSAQPMDRLVCG